VANQREELFAGAMALALLEATERGVVEAREELGAQLPALPLLPLLPTLLALLGGAALVEGRLLPLERRALAQRRAALAREPQLRVTPHLVRVRVRVRVGGQGQGQG
jgi:hypothetical protein